MLIGPVADPLGWDRWPEVAAMLEPARARGSLPSLLEDHEKVWVVMDGPELLGAATARLTVDGDCEVILVGGRDHRRWIKELNESLGAAARGAGATRLVACGRAGWAKSLKALGWDSQSVGGFTLYVQELGIGQEVKV